MEEATQFPRWYIVCWRLHLFGRIRSVCSTIWIDRLNWFRFVYFGIILQASRFFPPSEIHILSELRARFRLFDIGLKFIMQIEYPKNSKPLEANVEIMNWNDRRRIIKMIDTTAEMLNKFPVAWNSLLLTTCSLGQFSGPKLMISVYFIVPVIAPFVCLYLFAQVASWGIFTPCISRLFVFAVRFLKCLKLRANEQSVGNSRTCCFTTEPISGSNSLSSSSSASSSSSSSSLSSSSSFTSSTITRKQKKNYLAQISTHLCILFMFYMYVLTLF